MEVISIEGTSKTPSVHIDLSKGILKIIGRSMPEDATQFYNPVIDWFRRYSKNPNPELTLDVHLEYFNTSSSKNLLEIFKVVTEAGNPINWYYDVDDEDMQEAGEDFIFIVGESIRLIEKQD